MEGLGLSDRASRQTCHLACDALARHVPPSHDLRRRVVVTATVPVTSCLRWQRNGDEQQCVEGSASHFFCGSETREPPFPVYKLSLPFVVQLLSNLLSGVDR